MHQNISRAPTHSQPVWDILPPLSINPHAFIQSPFIPATGRHSTNWRNEPSICYPREQLRSYEARRRATTGRNGLNESRVWRVTTSRPSFCSPPTATTAQTAVETAWRHDASNSGSSCIHSSAFVLLPRCIVCNAVLPIAKVSVRLSVCPSVTA